MSTHVDAARCAREWINSVTGLVGVGLPLGIGAVFRNREGAATVPYVFLVETSADVWGGSEHPSMRGTISHQIYGPTRESASDGAVALAQALIDLSQGHRAVLPVSGATIVGADNVDGPMWLPDGEEPRYVVEADYLFL